MALDAQHDLAHSRVGVDHEALGGLSHSARISLVALMLGALASMLMALVCFTLQGRRNVAAETPQAIDDRVAVIYRRVCQSVHVIVVFLSGMSITVVVPESYNLSRDLGQGPFFSGVLIGSLTVGRTVAMLACRRWLLDPWEQRRNKMIVIVVGCVGNMLMVVLYACGAAPPEGLATAVNLRAAVILCSRLLGSLVAGVNGILLRMMALKMTPKSEMVPLQVTRNIFLSLGLGTGPIFSTACSWALGLDTVRSRAAIPLLVMAAFWFVLLIVCCVALPSDKQSLDHLTSLAQRQDAEQVASADTERDRASEDSGRKTIWISSISVSFERAMMVSALEAATSFILEVEFGWDTPDIGLAVAASFIVGVPFTLLLTLVRQRKWVTDAVMLCIVTFICTLATMLLFNVPFFSGVWPILVADFVIMPMGYVGNGIAEGLAFERVVPGTFYSQGNLIVISTLVEDTIGRFIGPPVARELVDSQGRNTYAAYQLVFSCFSLWTAFVIKRAVVPRRTSQASAPLVSDQSQLGEVQIASAQGASLPSQTT